MRFKLLDAAKEIGATNVRIGVTWCVVEEKQGVYDWEKTDRRVDFLHDNGFELAACAANTPVWASGLDRETLALVEEKYSDFMTVLPCADEYLPALAKWCEEAARRYKGKIRYYEVGNEDDGCPAPIIVRDFNGKAVDVRMDGDPAIYTKRLKTCYEAIKRADPDARVSVSGLAASNSTGFLQQIYACGGRDYFDAVAIHPYSKLENGINWSWLEQTMDLLRYMSDSQKKLWLTEWGYGINDNDPEDIRKQAEAIEQVLLRMEKMECIEQASLHILNDWQSHESNPDSVQKMGLMSLDLQPRPAFYAFRRAANGEGELRDSLKLFEEPKTRKPGEDKPVQCPYMEQSPTFSGNVNDWSSAESVPMVSEHGHEQGHAFLAWDNTYMYIALEIESGTQYQPIGGESMWKGDCLQIAFDPDREPRRWPGYDYDDTEYGFCLTPAGAQGIRFNGGINFRGGAVVPFVNELVVVQSPLKLAIKYSDCGYLYEIAIPWAEITLGAIADGKTIGLSLACNDYDSSGHRTVYEYGSGITEGKDPSLFKPIVLA